MKTSRGSVYPFWRDAVDPVMKSGGWGLTSAAHLAPRGPQCRAPLAAAASRFTRVRTRSRYSRSAWSRSARCWRSCSRCANPPRCPPRAVRGAPAASSTRRRFCASGRGRRPTVLGPLAQPVPDDHLITASLRATATAAICGRNGSSIESDDQAPSVGSLPCLSRAARSLSSRWQLSNRSSNPG